MTGDIYIGAESSKNREAWIAEKLKKRHSFAKHPLKVWTGNG